MFNTWIQRNYMAGKEFIDTAVCCSNDTNIWRATNSRIGESQYSKQNDGANIFYTVMELAFTVWHRDDSDFPIKILKTNQMTNTFFLYADTHPCTTFSLLNCNIAVAKSNEMNARFVCIRFCCSLAACIHRHWREASRIWNCQRLFRWYRRAAVVPN